MNGKNLVMTILLVAILAITITALIRSNYVRFNIGVGTEGDKSTSQVDTANQVVSQVESPTLINPGPALGANVLSEVSGIKEIIPVETLKATFKNKYTQASVTTNASTMFYLPGAKVSDPNVKPLDAIDANNGSTTNYIIQTNTAYDAYINGSLLYYDKKITPSISYNKETGRGYLLLDSVAYVPLSPFGAYTSLDTLPEVQSGWNQSVPANCSYTRSNGTVNATANHNMTNIIIYDEDLLGGSAWFRIDIGNDNSNSEIQDSVLCFTDNDGDMENDELTALTASYVSGSRAITLPGNLLDYWKRAMGGNTECVKIALVLGSSEKARWELTFTTAETQWEELNATYVHPLDAEEFEIRLDDLGDYLEKQYPSAQAKVISTTLTIAAKVNDTCGDIK